MSEELLQTIPQKIGKYTYYRLGSTTLDQLKKRGGIPKKNYGVIKRKKPDGLITHHGKVKAVVEYKLPDELNSEIKIKKAISQEIDVAKELCKILIITDGSKSIWINALNGNLIKDAKNNLLTTVFHPFPVKNIGMIEYLLDEIDASLSLSNSAIRSAKLIDPTPLATRLWQTIWVATGKSPVKCLYNVVELFIFKFLSDLQILSEDIAFNGVFRKGLGDPSEALDYYARNSRPRIYKLFPEGKDGTTVINGTIFVNEKGEANLSQSILFQRCLEHLHKYSEEFGSLTKIDKQFKTKLYESFLKQEVEALGQYFTPRTIIQSMIRMAGLDEPSFQYNGKRICDPFCGVGGFLLEILNMNEGMKTCYTPDANGHIHIDFVMHGFDKGFEREDERTIILGKANMLIYLAELIFTYPQCTVDFAHMFNETFTLFKDNLGTFGYIIEDEEDKYDYILSNPPYVTKGSSIIKKEIKETPSTRGKYPINALGLESLSLEWIVRSLKKGGRAFVIIPDGILGRVDNKLRKHILAECFLDAIVSLPDRTFFSNFENTYILVFTKKNNQSDIQKEPVFTYLVSNIGERLTSIKREEIDNDDLPEMEGLFKIFSGARSNCKTVINSKDFKRCKILDIDLFMESDHWIIDRWWSREERIALGIEESVIFARKDEVDVLLAQLNSALNDYDKFVDQIHLDSSKSKEVSLNDPSLFNLFIGERVLKHELPQLSGDIPLYSANVFDPFGYINKTNIEDFSYPCILWAIDGNFEFNIIPHSHIFATTDHCGTIKIRNRSVAL